MEEHATPQFVGIDLHGRRSVIVRMTGEGEVLEAVRISNGADQLTGVLERAVQVTLSDLFGVAGTEMLDELALPAVFTARIGSQRRLIEALDFEVELFAGPVRGRLHRDPSYLAVQTIPGIGPILGAVFVAEIGDITRFARPEQLACWAGLTPKHRESDTKVHRGRITKQSSRLVRWAAVESVQRVGKHTAVGRYRDRLAERRGHNIAVVAAARKQIGHVFYAARA